MPPPLPPLLLLVEAQPISNEMTTIRNDARQRELREIMNMSEKEQIDSESWV